MTLVAFHNVDVIYSMLCHRTNIGRARAWIRLALMQKKLADYMRTLVEKMKDVLADYYGNSVIRIRMATTAIRIIFFDS